MFTNTLPPSAGRDAPFVYQYGQQPPPHAGQSSPTYNPYAQQVQNGPYATQQPGQGPPPQVQYGAPHHQHAQGGYPPRPGSPGYNGPRYVEAAPSYYGASPAPYSGRPGEYVHEGLFSKFELLTSHRVHYQGPEQMHRLSVVTGSPQATGMYTRNLIGSLSASAFRLTDPNDKIGIWFVLQDLSVRTEGSFRSVTLIVLS